MMYCMGALDLSAVGGRAIALKSTRHKNGDIQYPGKFITGKLLNPGSLKASIIRSKSFRLLRSTSCIGPFGLENQLCRWICTSEILLPSEIGVSENAEEPFQWNEIYYLPVAYPFGG